jgi:hypothetical protein
MMNHSMNRDGLSELSHTFCADIQAEIAELFQEAGPRFARIVGHKVYRLTQRAKRTQNVRHSCDELISFPGYALTVVHDNANISFCRQ